jgi:hypothetical protein
MHRESSDTPPDLPPPFKAGPQGKKIITVVFELPEDDTFEYSELQIRGMATRHRWKVRRLQVGRA